MSKEASASSINEVQGNTPAPWKGRSEWSLWWACIGGPRQNLEKVTEVLGWPLSGHGEHDYLLIEKTGANTEWDFVEAPSQIMEEWCWQPAVLQQFAFHYQTGEPIPDALIAKIKKASTFNQGFVQVEYLAASLLDMAYHTLREAEANPLVAVVVLTGAGGNFSSGADLSGGRPSEAPRADGHASAFFGTEATLLAFGKPLIAAVCGVAVGGGCTIALAADITYVGESLRARLPFANLGLVPEIASSYTLQAAIGRQRANEVMLTAEWIDAERALELVSSAAQVEHDLVIVVDPVLVEVVRAGELAVEEDGALLGLAHLDPGTVEQERTAEAEGGRLMALAALARRSPRARLYSSLPRASQFPWISTRISGWSRRCSSVAMPCSSALTRPPAKVIEASPSPSGSAGDVRSGAKTDPNRWCSRAGRRPRTRARGNVSDRS